MNNPYNFINRALQVGFNITLDSHMNHSKSKLTIEPSYIELGNDTRYNNKTRKQMATIYARLKSKMNLNIKQ